MAYNEGLEELFFQYCTKMGKGEVKALLRGYKTLSYKEW